MNKTFQKEPFYSKFVNDDNLSQIEDSKIKRKYFSKTYVIAVFAMLPSLYATFIGFNFTHLFSIIIFVMAVISEVVAIAALIKLYLIDSEHHVFRRKLYFWLFYLAFFAIGKTPFLKLYFKIKTVELCMD